MKKIALLLALAGMISYGTPTSSAADDAPSSVDFENVTVTNATNLSSKPKVTAESKLPAAKIKVKDLVVGTGESPTPTSSVKVQ